MPVLVFFFRPIAGFAIRLLAHVFSETEVVGRENIPRDGPLLLVANHINAIDPTLLLGFTPRRLSWMAKQELFENPFSRILATLYESFPVRRFEADLGALRTAMHLLQEGRVVGIFPEGTRSRNGHMQKAHPGAAMIALRSGVPVLPVGISGTEPVKLPYLFFHPFPRPRIRIVFGEPFELPKQKRLTSEAVNDATVILIERISALLPEHNKPEATLVEQGHDGDHTRA
jgi:1-acyl-sn-glycerol-3-phosphate acyltransferase